MMAFVSLAKQKADAETIRRAKALRKSAPLAERILWNALRENAKNTKLHFRRQHPIQAYIVDFVCIRASLIIEIDGPSHDMRMKQDAVRDTELMKRGFEVLRFTNEDVLTNLDGVVDTIIICALGRLLLGEGQ